MHPNSSIHWSAYPALLLAGAFAGGVALNAQAGIEEVLVWSGGVGLGVVLFAGMQWWDRRRMVTLASLGRIVAVLLMVGSAGGARHAAYEAPSPRALEPIASKTDDQTLTLEGFLRSAPERSPSKTRFTMVVDTVIATGDTTGVEGQVRVTLQSSPWKEQKKSFPRLYEGDRLRLRGEVRPAPGKRNPGGFDYAAYLSRRGTCCTMYVGDPSNVTRLQSARGSLTTLVVTARSYVQKQITRFVPSSDSQAVLLALLLGDRSRITDAQRERFARTGLMHLLAVSGLHVFLVGMVLYVLLRPLLMRCRLRWHTVEVGRAVLTILVLGFYMLLTGARPSVVRAVVMSGLFIGGIVFQRSTHPLNTLGVAALVLLVFRPTALFDVGFQLSMAAVAGIVTLHPRLVEKVPEKYRSSVPGDWLISMLSVSAAAMLGTAPVLLYHFGWVSVGGLVLNVVGIPSTGLALSAAVAMEGMGGLWPTAGAAFGSTADLFVQGILYTSRQGAEWLSWAGIRMGEPDPWLIGTVVAGVLAIAQWPRPRFRWRCILFAMVLLVGSIWTGTIGRDAQPTLDLIFFDVGQGDVLLVTGPDDTHVLIDTGPRSYEGSSEAEYSVLPYLERRGIDRLDAVVVTHPDGDHLGGLPSILEAVSVEKVIHSGQQVETELYEETRRLLERQRVLQRNVERGDVLFFGKHLRVQVLGPPRTPALHGIESENSRSVVLHLAYGKTDVLLPGDIEEEAEHDLVDAYGRQLTSRVVKIPHHGSKTSSTETFVRAVVDTVRGTRAVVSAGESNRFSLPDEEVVRRWESTGASMHSTKREGAVWLRSNGESVWRHRWK